MGSEDKGEGYKLTGADASAFCALLEAQSALGPARQTPGQQQFWAFFTAIDSMAYDYYRFISNSHVKSWADKLFAALLQTQTCYGTDATGLYVVYSYAQFCGSCWTTSDGINYEVCEACRQQGFPTNWEQRGGAWPYWDDHKDLPTAWPWNGLASAVGLWKPPGSPGGFFDALNKDVNVLNEALHAAGHEIPAIALFSGSGGTRPDPASVQQYEQSLFDPKNWTDSQAFVQNLVATGIWQAQSQTLTALLQPTSLTADSYFFLLHLLIALCTSTAADQQLAQKVVSASTTSPEYPNDTFINQVVYLALMYLTDPMGNFAWTNSELQAEIVLLEGLVTSQDPASQAVHTSLTKDLAVLRTDTAYPMQDPYSPSIGFTQRMTDTLFALDKARYTLNP